MVMRPLLPILLPLLATSCAIFGGLSEEEQKSLEVYRKNADDYFNRASTSNQVQGFYRSLDQIDKGLELVPDDYRLKSRRAWCFLMLGKRDPRFLTDAETAFKDVMPLRSDDDHDPRTLLGYGLTLHRLGLIQRIRAEILEDEVKHQGAGTSDSDDPKARASEHRKKADAYFHNAERQLLKLVAKEDRLTTAYRHLINLKEHQGDRAAVKRYGEAYLERCQRDREYWEKKYQATTVAGYEANVVVPALEDLDRNELQVRDTLSFAYQQDREYKKAIEHLDRMLHMQPNRPIYYYNRGDCYRALAMDAAAKRDFKKFLGTTALPPEHPKVKHAFEFTYR
jgi:tetratricopeptide (TPR) repeat protein